MTAKYPNPRERGKAETKGWGRHERQGMEPLTIPLFVSALRILHVLCTKKVTLAFACLFPVSDSEDMGSVNILAEKDFQKVMCLVAVMLVFRSRVVTINGGGIVALPPMFANWLEGLLNDAAQQMPISSMDKLTEELKKALLLSKPVGEQVCCNINGPPYHLCLGVSNVVLLVAWYCFKVY
jgi:hypothetical protein